MVRPSTTTSLDRMVIHIERTTLPPASRPSMIAPAPWIVSGLLMVTALDTRTREPSACLRSGRLDRRLEGSGAHGHLGFGRAAGRQRHRSVRNSDIGCENQQHEHDQARQQADGRQPRWGAPAFPRFHEGMVRYLGGWSRFAPRHRSVTLRHPPMSMPNGYIHPTPLGAWVGFGQPSGGWRSYP